MFKQKPSTDLLGREVKAQVGLNVAPMLQIELMGVATLGLASAGCFVGLCGLVPLGASVTFEFAADGGRAPQKLSRNACQNDSLAFEAVDLVSFGLGQVFVGHGAR